ncbi:MAG: efflux transporter outer membrane subunit [Verrucomicrobiota bacterium]
MKFWISKIRPHFFGIAVLGFTSCAVGPNYQKPTVDVPPNWRWKKAEPQEAQSKGEWWKFFRDEKLDALEEEALKNNQDLKASFARVDESRAKARVSASDFFPELHLDPAFQRQRTSANAPIPFPIKVPSITQNSFSVPFDLSYEVDLWGRVRRSFESARDQAQATNADQLNLLLSITADVARDYFSLRETDLELEILRQDEAYRGEALDLQEKRLKAGLTSQLDISRAKNELFLVRGDLSQAKARRSELEANLAVLCGQTASSFKVSEYPLKGTPPSIPVGLPSSLLERRPDVAFAERTLAARNAEIGVAYAAFFPSVHLTGQAGMLSAEASDLFSWESRVWSFGPSVSLPLFSNGRNLATLKEARAAYEEAVAHYRQQVLIAFADVEQSLAQVQFYREQENALESAQQESASVVDLIQQKYKTGTGSYFEVITAQRDLGLRYSASIRLIKALGGSW